jgi:hypothetical protein
MSDRLLFAYSNYYVGNLLWVRVPLHQQRSHAVIVLSQLVVVEMHTMTAYSHYDNRARLGRRLAGVCSVCCASAASVVRRQGSLSVFLTNGVDHRG